MQPLVIGLNIKSISVETLETLSIHHSVNSLRLEELAEFAHARGVLILSTCNRLEFYAAADDTRQCYAEIEDLLIGHGTALNSAQKQEVQDYLYRYEGKEAVRHLYRVVSGLDSMVLGETEILGQVARAYEYARHAGTTDKILNCWFQRALHVGKLVRTEFGLDQYHTSVGRIAVDLAEQELGCLNNKQILILGAGEMSELTMKHLISKEVSLVMVSNRSLAKAQKLAHEHGFEACALDELPRCLEWADLVFSATSSKKYLVTLSLLKGIVATRKQGPLVFIDMAVPRDIDPNVKKLAGVRCFDIKQLHDMSDRNHEQRKQAAYLVETIIDAKVEEFAEWLAVAEKKPALGVIRQHNAQTGARIRRRNRLVEFSEANREVAI